MFWKFPYIQESEIELRNHISRFNKFLNNAKIIPVFKTFKTANVLHRKDKMPSCLATSIVYKFSCEHCNKCCIGETSTDFGKRIKEHLSGHWLPSEITLHHHMNYENSFSVIARSNNTRIAISTFKAASDKSTLLNSNTTLVPLYLFVNSFNFSWHGFTCSVSPLYINHWRCRLKSSKLYNFVTF